MKEMSGMNGSFLGDANLVGCPSCSQMTLRVENGCHSCVNEDCGFSKCDV